MYVPALHTIQATPLLFAILPFAQDVQFLLPAKTATFPLKHLAHGIVGEAEKNPRKLGILRKMNSKMGSDAPTSREYNHVCLSACGR